MLFDGWHDLFRTLVVGVSTYAGLILILRIAGKRTLSKMNAFDLVVTVAIGSTLATVITSKDVALAEGLLALALLVGLQVLVAFLTSRLAWANQLVKSEPKLLLRDGQPLMREMRRERITHDDLQAAAREQGVGDLGDVQAIILEASGELSVIPRTR